MLKDCLNSLLHELPAEPLPYIQNYFNTKGTDGSASPTASAAGAAAEEAEESEAAVQGADEALMRADGGAGGLGLGGHVYDSSEEEESETEEEEDELGELPAMDADYEEEERKKRERIGGKRRNSVSSESHNKGEAQKEFPVHEKKPDQELRIFNIISKSILLKHLDTGPIQIVTKAMFEHKVAPGECVMKQGEDGDNFYIIDEGVCDIFVKGIDAITPDTKDGPQTHEEFGGRVQICGQADSFGELALMYNAPRAATVVAREEMTLWALDRTTFRSMVMGQAISKRSKHSKFLEGVKLLSTLTQSERETVIDNMEEEIFEEGDEIITQGDSGSKFYIVTEGDVVITQTPEGEEEPKEVGRVSQGAYFGEVALLTNQTRLATCTATSKVSCVTLERKVFTRVMGNLRDLLRRDMALYNSYISVNL
jgi:cAMP-dependent protein kinase regulator